jgi:hypothetical protein
MFVLDKPYEQLFKAIGLVAHAQNGDVAIAQLLEKLVELI